MANKRYNLVLPEDTFEAIQRIADKRGTTVLEVLRRFIALGRLADEAEKKGEQLILRGPDREREIMLI